MSGLFQLEILVHHGSGHLLDGTHEHTAVALLRVRLIAEKCNPIIEEQVIEGYYKFGL